MVDMLIISDKIKNVTLKSRLEIPENIDIERWDQKNSKLSDYEFVVLDMDVRTEAKVRNCIDKREEVLKLLEAGGVVLCLTFDIKNVNTPNRIWDQDLGKEKFEINYDWLYKEDITDLDLNKPSAIGKNIEIKSKNQKIRKYFEGVKAYHKTIGKTVTVNEKKQDIIFYEKDYRNFDIFAINKVTKEPIAGEISSSGGSLVFLPQNSFFDSKDPKIFLDSLLNLYDFGKILYEKNKEGDVTAISKPDWLRNHKSKQELALEKNIEIQSGKLKDLEKQKKKFEIIDMLLYGYSKPLEKAVKLVLEDWGLHVRETEKGAVRDLIAKRPDLNLIFTLEVTGSKKMIKRADKKYGQLLSHLQTKKDEEKLIFIANTYRELNPRERVDKEHFSKPTKDLSERNNICLIKSIDIFNLWKDYLNGRKDKEILKSIADCDGEYNYESMK